MGILDIFSSGNERAAADARIQGLQGGYNLASDLYGQGRTAATDYFTRANQPFQTLFDQSQRGQSAYFDATGINGPEGMARARTAFTSTPGYVEGLTSGLDQLDRRAASRGMLGSGNTNQDTIRFANDYANQRYGDYVSRLLPIVGQGQGAATGVAGVNTGLGSTLNNSFQNQGSLGYQTQAGIGNANAAYELSKDQTGLNQLGGIFGGLNLAGRLAGSFGF